MAGAEVAAVVWSGMASIVAWTADDRELRRRSGIWVAADGPYDLAGPPIRTERRTDRARTQN
jgi:hypothetical protein